MIMDDDKELKERLAKLRKDAEDRIAKERAERIDNVIAHFEKIGKFTTENIEWICSLPNLPKDVWDSRFVPLLIKLGAVPKKDLVVGRTYKGFCRNASEAVWDGERFTYQRTKFGCTFPEKINHFEDYTEYDVFTPVFLMEEN